MIHELIFLVFIFVSIGAGVWAVVLTNQLHKTYKLNYLLTYLYYQILLFIFGLYGLIGMSLVKWLMQEMETPTVTVETIANFIPILGIPFIIVAWYLFIKMSMEIIGKSLAAKWTVVYFLSMLSFKAILAMISFSDIVGCRFRTPPALPVDVRVGELFGSD